VGRDAAAQTAPLHFEPELAAARGLRPEQNVIARREEARVLVEVGEAKARAVFRVGRQAAAQTLAQCRLVGSQQIVAAALVEREHLLLERLVDALQPPAKDDARRLRRPDARLEV